MKIKYLNELKGNLKKDNHENIVICLRKLFNGSEDTNIRGKEFQYLKFLFTFNIFNTNYYYNNINIGLIKRKLKQQLIWMISCCFNKLLLFNLIFISISLILGIKSWHSVHLVQRYGIKISSVF